MHDMFLLSKKKKEGTRGRSWSWPLWVLNEAVLLIKTASFSDMFCVHFHTSAALICDLVSWTALPCSLSTLQRSAKWKWSVPVIAISSLAFWNLFLPLKTFLFVSRNNLLCAISSGLRVMSWSCCGLVFFGGFFFFSTLMASKAVNGFWVFFATTGDCFLWTR